LAALASGYSGPECPQCGAHLDLTAIVSGAISCAYCQLQYEAVVFNPPRPRVQVIQLAGTGPEGGAACANHARNAAVTNCTRCGLLICALCDMNLGTGSYCPSCFERMRSDGSLTQAARRYRDWASIGRITLFIGLIGSFMFLSLPGGILAMYYGVKAIKQRREEGRSTAGPVIIIILGVLETVAGLAYLSFLLWSLFNTTKAVP
jgi:uncharacterized paraquat-inducible protein A